MQKHSKHIFSQLQGMNPTNEKSFDESGFVASVCINVNYDEINFAGNVQITIIKTYILDPAKNRKS